MNPQDREVKRRLDEISTRWGQLGDPVQFLFRYGPAIRQYLSALLKNPEDVEEISQDILTRVVRDGFAGATPEKGRFRGYLKTAVRNAALTLLRKKAPTQPGDSAMEMIAAADAEADRAWLADWQRCMLNRAWRSIENHQRRTKGNLFALVLRLTMERPEAGSEDLAEEASRQAGRTLNAAAFRKQVSRARQMFAGLLVEEVRRTLETPTDEAVRDELIEVGLMPYVRGFVDLG